jgi:pSer/pThr/pTyr-binding forkhead associated (FHA) protein
MKLFLQACGIEDHFQLCVEDRNRSESQQMVFQRPYVVIGRTPDADLTLDHWQVSRRHTYLQVVAGRLYCLDLGSRTGTHWEGPPSRWRWMTRGQAIHIGPYRISSDTLVDGDDDSTGGETPPPSSDELPRVALVPLDGREDPVILDEALSLMGRSPICRIRLSDPTLSKFHASLIRTRLGVWMVDLLGAGGITINRTRLRAARLNEGDEIGVGQQQFRVAYAQPDAYPTLFDEDVIEPVGSILARYEAPVNHNWLPNANAPSGPPGRDTGTGFVMGDPMNPRGTTGLPESVMIAQALLAPMLNQFASMQQQMFEQFHQSMMMMMQSMHMMHRERMDSVDKELEEVRRLTRELNALKAEAARLEAEEAAKAAA